LTVDYCLLNVLGFTCYTVYTAALLFDKTVRQQYAARYPGSPQPTVRGNDFAFALHAVAACTVTYSQFSSRLWGFSDVPEKRAGRVTHGVFCGSIVAVLIIGLIVAASGRNGNPGATDWVALDVVGCIEARVDSASID